MENVVKVFCAMLAFVLSGCSTTSTAPETAHPAQSVPSKSIGVIELRNYLVKPGAAATFNDLFSAHFQSSMQAMGVSILGRFRIKKNNDHFVWIRGYETMAQRQEFLNDYYYGNAEWKKYKKDANALIRNSDNVCLLRPLSSDGTLDARPAITSSVFGNGNSFAVVDFYIANTRLRELATFFTSTYLPRLSAAGCNTTLWISETSENGFPQLPVFQDKNLLVAITFYRSEKEYKAKSEKLEESLSAEINAGMQDIVTIHNRMLLVPFNETK
ncbi:MAG: hypothetical protein EOO51_14450 [Flavobacterium sp.]|nr:MAG: hypothetical protein EOO51_14450 [Flavobacterium sp.]